MMSLNTLRTKFGVVLSVVIGVALLAFILSLKTELGFTGNDPKVGVMNGEKINYSEYYNRYEQIKAQSGMQESNEQQAAALANATWQALMTEHIFEPALEQTGLSLSEAERMALLSGEQFSQTLYNAFADATGAYNVAAVSQFLMAAETDPQAAAAWAELLKQVRLEVLMQKYYGLVKNGVHVNPLEIANGVNAANETFSGKVITKPYSSVPDSLFKVSSSEIKAYYKANKNSYKKQPSRSISYVVFEVSPTEQDLAALEQEVKLVGEEFAATKELKSYTRSNRFGTIAQNYVSADQLMDDEAAALMAGKTYGPVLKNNEWTMARALDTKMLPDSIGLRHIVLPYTETALADSLMTVLKGGADFAALAAQYSAVQTAAVGGELGVMPFAGFPMEFVEALQGAKKGQVVKVASGDALQLLQVTRVDKPTKHVQVASIVYPVEASSDTRRVAHTHAGSFTVNAKEGFNEAATTAAVTPRVATLRQGDRMIAGLEESREVARWAFGAKEGDVSEIFTVGDDYVIATLTKIDEEEYTSVQEVAPMIRQQLLRDKKYDYVVNQIKGATLEEVAAELAVEPVEFSDVTYGSYYIAGAGLEPRLVGAIATTEETGKLSAPVKGMTGVCLFVVDAVENSEAQTAEAEQVRAQAVQESIVAQYALQAIQEMAGVEDLRGQYF